MKKLIPVFIALMLAMTGAVAMAQYQPVQTNSAMADDNVPTWELGNGWAYDVSNFEFTIGGNTTTTSLTGSISDLAFQVAAIEGTSYRLEFTGKLNGQLTVIQNGTTILNAKLYFTSLQGVLRVRQSDLAIVGLEDVIVRSLAILNPHPIPIPIISSLPIPLPFTASMSVTHNIVRPFIPFPLSDGAVGIIPEGNLSLGLDFTSILLRIVNMFIPSVPANFEVANSMTLPERPYQLGLESITVPAGTYDAYNLISGAGIGGIWYAPDVGFLAEIDYSIDAEGAFLFEFNAELTETNFTP